MTLDPWFLVMLLGATTVFSIVIMGMALFALYGIIKDQTEEIKYLVTEIEKLALRVPVKEEGK